MASTYSNLKIQLMTTGENSTTWGDVTNINLGTALEEAIVGSADVTFASANVTLTLTDTNASQTARNMRLRLTGTTGGARTLFIPSIEKVYIVTNDCTDGVLVRTVLSGAYTSINVPAGKTMWLYCDSENVANAVSHLSTLTLGTDLAIADGGTGANTAADARTNLGVPSTTGSGASGTWAISVSGTATTATTANALNTGNSYTVSGMDVNGLVYATTPNAGTSGGIVLRGNATTGNAILQVRDSTGVSQWGYAVVTSAGTFTWSGQMTATQFNGSGAGLTGTASSLTVGAATTATTASTANALNTGNSYQGVNFTATGRFRANNGSAAQPSYCFYNDGAEDTGFYWIADGQIGITCNGVFVGSIVSGGNLSMTGNVTAYSDARLKTDLVRIDGALDKLETLTGYVYTRTDTGQRQTGLLAQDVQAVLPEAVHEGEHLSLAYGNMMGLVVEAIKELRAEVAELRQQAVKVIK